MTLTDEDILEILFLSTPSGWRATEKSDMTTDKLIISIHALRVEGDKYTFSSAVLTNRFLSTPSGWRATKKKRRKAKNAEISIHALRVEGDPKRGGDGRRRTHFYPRPPGGGRHDRHTVRALLTLISIHALRVEGDLCCPKALAHLRAAFLSTPSGWRATKTAISVPKIGANFYPRPPGGGRPGAKVAISYNGQFLSTPSGWRATWLQGVFKTDWTISIHALRVEGDSSTRGM